VKGRDAFDVPAAYDAMRRGTRNSGRPGITARAISAVDVALWDLKTRLLDLRLTRLRAVDCLQADLSRCGGITEWQRVAAAAVAAANSLQISARFCAWTLQPQPRTCAIWSGSTTTSRSRTCCSTGRPTCDPPACCNRICLVRDTASISATMSPRPTGSVDNATFSATSPVQ
jgi:enolase-like protein/mandelate racemase/muconate lactonizing enzyme-like protein